MKSQIELSNQTKFPFNGVLFRATNRGIDHMYAENLLSLFPCAQSTNSFISVMISSTSEKRFRKAIVGGL